jgi:hypothetical protein
MPLPGLYESTSDLLEGFELTRLSVSNRLPVAGKE